MLVDVNACASDCDACVVACDTENGLAGAKSATASQWIRKVELRDARGEARFDPKKNPFYAHAEMELFVCYNGNEPVGRISARKHCASECAAAFEAENVPCGG